MTTLKMLVQTFSMIGFFLLATAVSATAIAQQKGKTDKPSATQLARGAKAWASTCGGCHNLRPPKDLNDEDWSVSVTHMRVRANIPGDVARDIVAFLKASN